MNIYTHTHTHTHTDFSPTILGKGLEFTACIICRGVRPHPQQKNGSLRYDTKLHFIMRLHFWRSGKCGVSLHCHYSQIHWPRVVISCMDHVDLFKNYLYLIGLCAKEETTTQKNININTKHDSRTFRHKITSDKLTCR